VSRRHRGLSFVAAVLLGLALALVPFAHYFLAAPHSGRAHLDERH